jgi:hypothetical protein
MRKGVKSLMEFVHRQRLIRAYSKFSASGLRKDSIVVIIDWGSDDRDVSHR